MNKPFYVKKKVLLIIAGIVWMIAGFNVARLGVISYLTIDIKWYYFLLSVAVFGAFGTMFFNMTRKHSKRILSYIDEYKPFWNFFDIKSYIIMVVMMSGGICLRAFHLVPDVFIAFFYSGLGCALFLAGVLFIINFIKAVKNKENDSAVAE